MSDGLVKRLRDWQRVWPEDYDKPDGHLFHEAADHIEALEAKLAKAMEALGFYAETCDTHDVEVCYFRGTMCCRTARAVIAELKGEKE